MTVETNPLLTPSSLPYALPDYGRIRAEHYLPAFRQGFEEQLAEVRRITMVRSMPTFENTMVALERSGELLDRAVVQEEREPPPLVLLGRDQGVEDVLVSQSSTRAGRSRRTRSTP